MDVNRKELQAVAAAATQMQIAVLWGMINAGIVDRTRIRDWLQSIIESQQDVEQSKIFVFCLQHVVDSLDRETLSTENMFGMKH